MERRSGRNPDHARDLGIVIITPLLPVPRPGLLIGRDRGMGEEHNDLPPLQGEGMVGVGLSRCLFNYGPINDLLVSEPCDKPEALTKDRMGEGFSP